MKATRLGGFMQEDLRALTLIRPWDEPVVAGAKHVENRTWKPPKELVGKFVAIHSGVKYDKEAAANMIKAGLFSPSSPSACKHSVIKGVVRVVDYVHKDDLFIPDQMTSMSEDVLLLEDDPLPLIENPWFFGPWGWLLDEAVKFPEPVPAKGMMGLWRVMGDLRDKVNEQWLKGLELAMVVCVGDGREGAGCGRDIVDEPSGGTCPHCGGMLLSKAAIKAAEEAGVKIAAEVERWTGRKP